MPRLPRLQLFLVWPQHFPNPTVLDLLNQGNSKSPVHYRRTSSLVYEVHPICHPWSPAIADPSPRYPHNGSTHLFPHSKQQTRFLNLKCLKSHRIEQLLQRLATLFQADRGHYFRLRKVHLTLWLPIDLSAPNCAFGSDLKEVHLPPRPREQSWKSHQLGTEACQSFAPDPLHFS